MNQVMFTFYRPISIYKKYICFILLCTEKLSTYGTLQTIKLHITYSLDIDWQNICLINYPTCLSHYGTSGVEMYVYDPDFQMFCTASSLMSLDVCMSRIEYASPEGQVVNGCTVCEQMPNNCIQGGFTIPIVDSPLQGSPIKFISFYLWWSNIRSW